MSHEDQVFVNRLYDLAEQACATGRYRFSSFLGLHEQSLLHKEKMSLEYAGLSLWGGEADCERVVVSFGSKEICGYEADFPIALLQCSPTHQKYADALTHRDVLGALMGLGIERDTVGDIYLKDNIAYVFVLSHMAEMICRELDAAKHTSLKCEVIDSLPEGVGIAQEEKIFVVASERLDCIVAAVFNLSRETAANLFRHERVFVDGKLIAGSRTATENAIISVRGFGRFRYAGVESVSKKGKPRVRIFLYT